MGVVYSRPAARGERPSDQFKAIYVKPKTGDRKMQIFNAAVQAKGCGICHRGKAAKKVFNPYGKQVSKVLHKRDAGNPQAIQAALKQVEAMKSNPEDPKSPTFHQRIRQGKLPVGEIHIRQKDKDSSKSDASKPGASKSGAAKPTASKPSAPTSDSPAGP